MISLDDKRAGHGVQPYQVVRGMFDFPLSQTTREQMIFKPLTLFLMNKAYKTSSLSSLHEISDQQKVSKATWLIIKK